MKRILLFTMMCLFGLFSLNAQEAPQNLVATVNGQNSITVTWDAVEGAEDYYVYKDGTMWANTSGATTYTENGLAAGTECCFAVQAVGAAGESELSAEVCATTESIELAENEIIIGTATTKYYSPFLTILGGGSWFEAIYKSEEIGKACTISELAFSYKDGAETSADINIYLAETVKDEYANPADATAESELTLVYSGTAVTLCDEEWETFVLNAPFNYSGENNLVVVVTTANTGLANNWNCYSDPNTVLIKDVMLDSKKPVLKLTLGEGGETPDPTPDPDPEPGDVCVVEFELIDSYGDGWNGATLTVEATDGTSQTLVLTNGKTANYTIEIAKFAHVVVTFNKGTYDSECSFNIRYQGGSDIHLSPKMQAGQDYTFEFDVDCTPKAPDAPVVKTTVTGQSTVLLTWDVVSGATSYNVYRGTEALATALTETSYTVEGLEAATEYCFFVTAFNEVGESEQGEACATTLNEGDVLVSIGEEAISMIAAPVYDAGPGPLYSLSQQIYTNEEIGLNAGVIKSIAFNQTAGNNNVRNITVYMQNVEKASYVDAYDWVAFSDADIVYQGEFNFGKAGDWVTIEFPNGFEYTGDNLLVSVYDATGTAFGYNYDICDKFSNSTINEWRGMFLTKQTELDLTNLSQYYGSKMNTGNYGTPPNYYYVNNIRLVVAAEEGETPTPSIAAPQNLVATVNGQNSITVTWDAVEGAEDYYVYKDGTMWANTSGATTYTENGLAAGTECCFAVQAVGAAGESELSAEVCATTESIELAENEIVIGTATTKYYSPFLTILGGGSWFEAIYKSEEIGKACTISELAFSYKDGAETSADINIYLAETAKDEYANPTDVTAESALTLVYSGNGVTLCDEEWETFVLNAPFNYSGENNLVVVVTTENTSKANNWNCYEDANSVLIKDVFSDSKKPVMKLTLGEESEEPETPVVILPYRLESITSDNSYDNLYYVYNEKGQVTQVNEGSYATLVEYNADGTVAKTTYAFLWNGELDYSSNYTVTDYTYTEGVLTSYTKTEIISWGNPLVSEYALTYNEDGTVAKVTEDGPYAPRTYAYEYEDGKLVKETYSYYDQWAGDDVTEYIKEFEYDEYGNCVTETKYDAYNNPPVPLEGVDYFYDWNIPVDSVHVFAYPHEVLPTRAYLVAKALRYYYRENGETGEVTKDNFLVQTYNYNEEVVNIALPPLNLAAKVLSDTKVELTWETLEVAEHYNVRYNNELIAETTETSYTVENLTAGTEYCFTVTMIKMVAIDETAESAPSNEACATTMDVPSTPKPVAEYKYRISSLYAENGLQIWDYNYSDTTGTSMLSIHEFDYTDGGLVETKDSLYYDANGNITKIATWEHFDGEWSYVCYVEYTYNEQNLRTTRKNYNNFGTTMELGGTYYYNYDINGKMTDWRLEFFGLEEYEKGFIEYNEAGQKVSETIQQYDFETYYLRNNQLIEYEYDGYGNLVNEVEYYYSELDERVPSIYKHYDYDDFGNCIQFEQTTASGQVQERRVYTYDTSVLADDVFYYSNPEKDFPALPQMNNMLKSFEYYSEDNNLELVNYILDYDDIEEQGGDVPSTPKAYRLASKENYATTTYVYDATDVNRVVKIESEGSVDVLEYNTDGTLAGYKTIVSYEDPELGNVEEELGAVSYVYEDGRLVSYSELAQSWNGFIEVETEITYDAEGKVDKVVDSYGTVMTYEYNAEGLLIEKATGYEYDGIVEYDSKEAYTYQNGKLEKTEYLYYDWYLADGSFTLAEETVYEYDENSNCVLKEAYMVDENNLRTLYQTTEYYYNTTVSAEDVYTFEYPHFAFTYPVKPSSENVLTKEVSYYSYVDEATGEVVNHSHTYTTYNYDPEILSVPFAPTNLVATAVNTSEIVLSWDAVSGADYYNVYYDGLFVGQTSETTFLFGSFGVNIEHCFVVVAENAAGVSEYSDMACVTTYDFDDVCYVYFELADTYGDGWNGNYLEVAYNGKTQKLEMTGGSSLEHVLEIPTGSYVTVTYIVSQGYTWPEENSFVVRYENGAKILDMASGSLLETTFFEFYVDCSTAAPAIPAAPQNLVATAEGTSITLTWDAVVGAEYYAIYYFEDSTFNYYGSVSNPIGYIHNRVPGVTYCFTVTAINEAGESGPSNEACAMVEEQVSVIDIEVEVLSATSARVIATPNEATAEYHYIVINKSISDYIGIDSTMQFLYDDPYTLYEIDDYTWDVLEANTEYYVVARGQNAYGEWGEVTIVEFTTLSLQIPAAPTNLVAEVKSSSEIQLSWDDVEGAEYYNVYLEYEYIGYIAATACVVNVVEYGTHCFTVTAVNEAGESEHSNEACATIEDPIKVHSQALTSGWNWYSTYIVNEGADGLANLENAIGTSGIQIKNQSKFVNQAGGNWYGTLTETSVEDMFMIQLSSATNVTLEGYEVNPADYPITLGTNWKWISYPLSTNISVEEAFASANPSNGDYVKSQTGFAQYYDGLGWSGTLTSMTPGMGYMYQNKSGYAKTLVYPSSSSKGSMKSNVTTDNNHWTADYSKYPMNMTMIAVVEGAESAYEVAAFADGECRGSARPIYIEALDSYIMFMTISGEDGETLTFKYYDVNTGETYAIADEFTFSVNATVGDVMEPYVMTRGAMGIDELSSSINIYPNPVDNELFLATEIRVEEIAIYDIYGRQAMSQQVNETTSQQVVEVADLEAGVYFVKVVTSEGEIVKRFVKK